MEKQRLQIFAILVIVTALAPGLCRGQSGAQKNPNRILEIAPDAQSSRGAHDTRFSDQNNAFNPSNPDADNDIAAYENNTSPEQPAARRLKPLPYLGISAQPVSVFQWTGLQRQRGLLVMSAGAQAYSNWGAYQSGAITGEQFAEAIAFGAVTGTLAAVRAVFYPVHFLVV